MKTKRVRCVLLALGLGLGLALIVTILPGEQAWAGDAHPPVSRSEPGISSQPAPSAVVPNDHTLTPRSARAPADAGDVIEVFTNTWSYSTIGLVYNPHHNRVRYAHESQSSSHNPTIYDVRRPLPHSVLFSVALSTQNSGWPWQIDNRTGAGYDFVEGTYFMPDYNGDLSYADDNIVEIDADGTIRNAWEMDDEVGSNDSADGSEIDSIIDIAVVPGSPTRYFATAAYDGAVVYEIVLTRTGTLWTPNSWATLMTYTVPFTDNLGIDYDAENERLYHSGWHTTTILVTDLDMNPITAFDCPGAGGYNSGVTFIEGSVPPEVWVTDFSSDQTTRCQAVGEPSIPPDWEKWVAGQPWDPSLVVVTQTDQIVRVTDVVTAVEPFTLTESWDPDQLAMVGLDVFPPVATIITGVDSLTVIGPPGPPERVTVDKWFRVLPCDWITTTLQEELVVEGGPPFETRSVTITKVPPELHIDSVYAPEVYASRVASFTLVYSNTGGFENELWIRNTFPITAPFVFANPFPTAVGPQGLWAEWELGGLAQGDADTIDVWVLISDTVPTSSTITIWDGIFNHMGVIQDETFIAFHGNEEFFPFSWEKLVNGEPWYPGISHTLQTSQTLLIQEFIDPQGNLHGFTFIEEWVPDHLALSPGWTVEPAAYSTFVTDTITGTWILSVPPLTDFGPLTVTKEFHVEPCIWPETILWESLGIWSGGFRNRPVIVNKHQPELWIDSFFDVSVESGAEAQFVLLYGNNGGRESAFSIRNTFPPEATFMGADPWPTGGGPGDPLVEWDFPAGLDMGEEDRITVTVEITRGLPPGTIIEIWDGIYNHVDQEVDDTLITYEVAPPTWDKWVNGVLWTPDLALDVRTSDTFTVTDVISTHAAVAMVEHWNPERLSLMDYITEPLAGIILSNDGFLSWEFPGGGPGAMTITKIFHIQPTTYTYMVLWEELWVEDVEWERRPVHIDKPVRIYLPVILRNP